MYVYMYLSKKRIFIGVSACNAQYPTQETISEMPFGFWYIFQDDMIACEPPQFQLAIATFGPIYEELVNALMRKAMYSLQENEWTADQREAFRCYRTDIADTIMYCYVSTYLSRYLLLVFDREQVLKDKICCLSSDKRDTFFDTFLHDFTAKLCVPYFDTY